MPGLWQGWLLLLIFSPISQTILSISTSPGPMLVAWEVKWAQSSQETDAPYQAIKIKVWSPRIKICAGFKGAGGGALNSFLVGRGVHWGAWGASWTDIKRWVRVHQVRVGVGDWIRAIWEEGTCWEAVTEICAQGMTNSLVLPNYKVWVWSAECEVWRAWITGFVMAAESHWSFSSGWCIRWSGLAPEGIQC